MSLLLRGFSQSRTVGGNENQGTETSFKYLEDASPKSTSEQNIYAYQSLSTEEPEFRLFCFDRTASSKTSNSWITGTLKTVDFTDVMQSRLRYWALSYTWDPADEAPSGPERTVRRPITINNRKYFVRMNLYDALYRLRKWLSAERSGNFYFWIDAICINQLDEEEKSRQVKMMWLIYKHAQRVIIWLGPADPEMGDRVRKVLLRFRKLIRPLRAEAKLHRKDLLTYWEENLSRHERFFESQLPPPDHPCWEALAAFVNRRWWSRVWAVQEIALAYHAEFHCGDVVLAEEELSEINETLEMCKTLNRAHHGRMWSDNTRIVQAGMVMRYTLQIRHVSRGNVSYTGASYRAVMQGSTAGFSGPAFLLYLLDQTRMHKATESKDRVFGLLGLARCYARNEGPLLNVTYNKYDAAAIFLATAKYVITYTSWLGILALMPPQSSYKTLNLPSYVPNFVATYPLGFVMGGFANTLPTLLALAQKAPGEGRPRFQGDLLRIHGIQIGRIEAISEELESFHSRTIAFTAGANVLAGCAERYPYATNQSRFETLWRTLLEDDPDAEDRLMGDSLCYYWMKRLVDFILQEAQPQPMDAFLAKHPAYKEVLATSQLMTDLSHRLELEIMSHAGVDGEADFRSTPFYEELVAKSRQFEDWFQWSPSKHRCLCRTSNGHLGTVRSDARISDTVWILARAPWPVVLRQVEHDEMETRMPGEEFDRYRFVTLAYLQGYRTANGGKMLPDLLNDLEKGGRQWKSIAIE